jgi:multidrug efflux pump subunit AcrA (membrane-fusion protein)
MGTTPATPEALHALAQARTPRWVRWAARLLILFVLILVPVLLLAPWTQTAHGQGRAIAFNPVQRPQFVVSPIEGRVKKWHVMEGDKVKAGQILVDLVDNDPNILERLREQEMLALQRLTLADGRIVDQRNRLGHIKDERELLLAEARFRIDQAEQQRLATKEELERAKFDLEREQLNYDRLKKLNESKVGEVVSKDAVEEADRRLKLAQRQVPLVEARVKLAERSIDGFKAQRDATEKRTAASIQTEEANLKSAQSEQAAVNQQYTAMRIQVQRQENQRILAPTDGTVFRVLANAEAGGQLVRPGERLAVLVPDIKAGGEPFDPRKDAVAAAVGGTSGVSNGPVARLTPAEYPGIVAELYIDGNDLPLVRKGDRVLLQFEGWAAVQFASYPEAAAGTFEGRVFLVDPTAEAAGGRFRVLVEPAAGAGWPNEEYLRQGVRAQGWVLVKEVRLGYELWRLLNGFPPAREVKPKETPNRLGPVERSK